MAGGAVAGGLIMALGAGQLAPHGGIWVLPLIGQPFMFLIALIGVVVSALLVIVAKGIGRNPREAENEAAEGISPSRHHHLATHLRDVL